MAAELSTTQGRCSKGSARRGADAGRCGRRWRICPADGDDEGEAQVGFLSMEKDSEDGRAGRQVGRRWWARGPRTGTRETEQRVIGTNQTSGWEKGNGDSWEMGEAQSDE